MYDHIFPYTIGLLSYIRVINTRHSAKPSAFLPRQIHAESSSASSRIPHDGLAAPTLRVHYEPPRSHRQPPRRLAEHLPTTKVAAQPAASAPRQPRPLLHLQRIFLVARPPPPTVSDAQSAPPSRSPRRTTLALPLPRLWIARTGTNGLHPFWYWRRTRMTAGISRCPALLDPARHEGALGSLRPLPRFALGPGSTRRVPQPSASRESGGKVSPAVRTACPLADEHLTRRAPQIR